MSGMTGRAWITLSLLVGGTASAWAGQTYNPWTGRLDLCATIQEEDGSPSSAACQTLLLPNGSYTDNGDGTFTFSPSGSGDITDVGDCTTGACFAGASGTTLTFNDAGGDATLDYDGTDLQSSVPINISAASPSLLFTDSGGRNFELSAQVNGFFLDDATNSTTLLWVNSANELVVPTLASCEHVKTNAGGVTACGDDIYLLNSGDTATGSYDFTGAEFLGAIPLVFEGTTDDGVTASLGLDDPTVGNSEFRLPNIGVAAIRYIATDATAVTDLDGVGLAIVGNGLRWDATETGTVTWGAGLGASITHNYNLTGTDVSVEFGSDRITIDSDFTINNSGADLLLTDGTNTQGLHLESDGSLAIRTGTPTDVAYFKQNGAVRLPNLASCDTIDTDATGLLSCGTDDTGAGGGDPILIDGTAVTDGSGVDVQGGVGIAITFNAGVSPDTASLAIDATELDAVTWSDGANASNQWTFDVSGTDTTLTFGNGLITAGGAFTTTGDVIIDDASNTPSLTFQSDTAGDDDFGIHLSTDAWSFINATTGQELMRFGDTELKYARQRAAKVAVIEDLAAADDNLPLGPGLDYPVTVVTVGCKCHGTCTTPAQISLEDDAGNAMTHAAFSCNAAPAVMQFYSVTAGGSLGVGESVRMDVDNTPDPETDTYEVVYHVLPD